MRNMKKEWYYSDAAEVASMVGISDDLIIGCTAGDVAEQSDRNTDAYCENLLTNPRIFGTYSEHNLKMGYISLPEPIVNIQYLYGIIPILPQLLKIPRYDINKLVYYKGYLLETEDVIERKVYDLEKDWHRIKGKTFLTGARAIQKLLLEQDAVETAHIILTKIPVVPLCMRFYKAQNQKKLVARPLEYLYEALINRQKRLLSVLSKGLPEVVILNEKRLLQESVDDLINNGARRYPSSIRGIPLDSLMELYHGLKKFNPHETVQNKMLNGSAMSLDESAIIGKIREIREYIDTELNTQDTRYIELDEEEKQNTCIEIAEKELYQMLEPVLEACIHMWFEPYSHQYMTQMKKTAFWGAYDVLRWSHAEENLIEQMSSPIYKQLLFYVEKRVLWEIE